jgi:hypothetical protein
MKTVKLGEERRASIGFDQLSWDFIHTMAENLGCSVSACVRMLIRQEVKKQNKELML